MKIPPNLKVADFLRRDIILYQGQIQDTKQVGAMLAAEKASLLVTAGEEKAGRLFLSYIVPGEKNPEPGRVEGGIHRIDAYKTVGEDESLEAAFYLLGKDCQLLLALDKTGKPSGYLTLPHVCKALVRGWSQTQQLLDSLLEASEEIITIADREHNVIYWNQKAETFYGIKKRDILGQDLRSFFSDLVFTKVLATGKPVWETYHQPKPGLYVLINSLPVKLGDQMLGAVSLERDITEMVNLNRELKKATTHLNLLQQEIDQIQNLPNGPFSAVYGHSPRLKECVDIARKVAPTSAAVLIRGESGTGKELFAKAIHQAGPRKNKPFIALNCGAIPPNLFESELFGYEPGAFTGAEKEGKQGRFELADGGTLFLDEIGEMDFAMQVKLLRVLQDNIFFRVGGAKPVKVDVRIIAATNKDLEQMLTENRFRRDLYYRLNVVSLEIPPLRLRKGDIPELVYLFINEFSKTHGTEINEVSSGLMTTLLKYNWPGNIRELRNVIERLVVLSEGPSLNRDFLPRNILDSTLEDPLKLKESTALTDITSEVERKTILKALREVRGNKSKAARALGMPRSTFYYKLSKLGLDRNRQP